MTSQVSIAFTPEQQQLSAAVARFAARYAPVNDTRTELKSLSEGRLPRWWTNLVDNGFHAVHLPESVGGQGGGLQDMACVLEAAGAAMLPGPLLTTAIAGAAVATAADCPAARTLLNEITTGTTAVLVGGDFLARRHRDGWCLAGSSGLTPGLCSAQRLIVSCPDGTGAPVWAILDTTAAQQESPTLDVEARRGTDLTTDLGVLHLRDHIVPADALLTAADGDRVTALTVAFTASVTAGISQWCVQTVTEHLTTREQFGKPIGTFQALQHKAAMLLVNSALATAAAWDAVRALDGSADIEQCRLTASSAAVMAVMPIPGLVLETLTMLGAIGFTWEHDLHLYWRRATSLAASIGPLTRWTRQRGELSARVTRDPTVHLGTADADFRTRVADTLDRASTLSDDGFGSQGDHPEHAVGPRRDLLADAGLVAPDLPAPWGCDATVRQQLIVAEEFARRADLVRPSVGIAEWILPSIISAGSRDLQQRFVPPTLRGRLAWCQLFSEPGAGSDLASLSTRAVRVEGGWRINGHKIWTSMAHKADYGALLARTDPHATKHRGIGYFILDMSSPGVEFRQIIQSSGRSDFNEVFLTDVFVPDDMLLGEPTSGWQLAIGTMARERVAISSYVHFDRIGALRTLAAVSDDPGPLADAIGEIDSYTDALKALGVRETLRLLDGQAPGPASSIAKVATNVMLRRAAELTLALTGPLALEQNSEPAVVAPYLDLPAELIGGGTTEIQLNIIAQMILGLPRK